MTERLDGQALVIWLEGRGYRLTEVTLGFHQRLVRDWRLGENPSVFDADKVLTKLDLHVDLLPADLWVEGSPYVEELAA